MTPRTPDLGTLTTAVPRYVRVVDAFPMTVTGKVRKVEMRGTAVRDLQVPVE